MKLVLAVGLNAGLLLLLFYWLRREYRTPGLGRWLLPLLGLKLLLSLRDGLRPSADAQKYQYWADGMTHMFWDIPGAWLRMLFSDELHYSRWDLIYHGLSNTFFTMKLLSWLNLASLGSVVLNSMYLALFGFVGAWTLTQMMSRVFPATPRGAALVAFLAWPTVLFWTAGLTKESLLLGSAAWLLALVLPWLYTAEKPRPATALAALLLAVLQFKMRFFFAGFLFGALAGLVVIRLLQRWGRARRWWEQVLVLAAVLTAGVVVAGELSPVFRLNKITSQLVQSYSKLSAGSQPHLTYDLAPTVPSILRNLPAAVGNTLVRPWPWEGHGLLYLVAGVENLGLLLVIGVALVAAGRGRGGRLPQELVLVLLVYCVALAGLIGLSTPNLGTLNRYRAVLLPFVLLLALQNEYAARVLRRLGL